jgi:hypothetical protein
MSVVAATERVVTLRAMFHFFDMSFGETGPRRDCCHGIAWCRVAIVMFREVSLRQVGSSELKVTRPVSIVATRSISSSCFWFACLSDAFAPVGPQRSVSMSITAL